MSAKTKVEGKSLKEHKRAQRQRQQLLRRAAMGVVGTVILVMAGYFIWDNFAPFPGKGVPIQSRTHIHLGDPHEPYNSNPPTSGPHAEPVEAGFYDEAPPDENLVHNLEHGYVILWYDCTGLDQAQCDALKGQIKTVMDRASTVGVFSRAKKLIAVPRAAMPMRLALTSWGRLLRLDSFDEAQINGFINRMRRRSPEPDAP